MSVRLAGPDDFDAIFDLRAGLHAENALRDALGNPFPLDDDKVRTILRRALHPKDETGFAGFRYPAWIGVIGSSDYIEGAVYLAADQPWYSTALFLGELFVYVRPEHRRSSHAQRLIEWSKRHSRKVGIQPLMIGIITQDREAAKSRLYRKQLGEPAGSVFLHTSKGT